MNRITSLTATLLFIAATAQADLPATPEQQLAAALRGVQEQQAQIVANQTKIEEKLAALADQMRLARIFASRSGR